MFASYTRLKISHWRWFISSRNGAIGMKSNRPLIPADYRVVTVVGRREAGGGYNALSAVPVWNISKLPFRANGKFVLCRRSIL